MAAANQNILFIKKMTNNFLTHNSYFGPQCVVSSHNSPSMY